jgi:signal transduction histidine kinase/PAS domain-containing protein
VISRNEHIQTLYELSMSFGGSLDLDAVVRGGLGTTLRKLNCAGGQVFAFEEAKEGERLGMRCLLSMPRRYGAVDEFPKALAAIFGEAGPPDAAALVKRLPLRIERKAGEFLHAMSLDGFGVLVLDKRGEDLSPALRVDLEPVLGKFAEACLSCVKAGKLEALLASNNRTLRDLTASRTALLNMMKDMKRAEAEIQEHSEYTDALLSAMPDLLFVLDRSERFLDVQASAEWLLMPPERFLGKTVADVLPPALAESLRRALGVVFREGRPCQFDYQLTLGVDIRDFDCRLVPFGEDRALALARDVTDRRTIERRLGRHAAIDALMARISMQFINVQPEHADRLIGEALGEVGREYGMDRVYVFSYSDNLETCSNDFEWCAEGVEPQIENLQNVPSSTTPWWTARMKELRNMVVADVGQLPPEASGERELLASQGIQSLLAVPLTWGGRVEGFIGFDLVRRKTNWGADEVSPLELLAGIVHNAMKHREGQNQLREINATLERRVEERTREVQAIQSQLYVNEKMASVGQLAAGVAHEINNPVSFVSTNFATLEQIAARLMALLQSYREGLARMEGHPEHPALAQRLAEMEKRMAFDYVAKDLPALFEESRDGFRRITDIVNSMRSFARMDQIGEVAPFDLNAGIHDTLVISRNAYKYAAAVEFVAGDVPAVRCAGGQINQVLLNLIVNAAQALGGKPSTEEKGLIRIRTGTSGDEVFCEVEDNGPGIAPEAARHVFDPFFTTKAPGEGTGLGLSISYDIVVNKHGGTLTFEPAPGGGALFRMTLPRDGGGESATQGESHG